MAIHAAAVEILIERAKFEPGVALGIAEAIGASIMEAQVVTVPILDGKLQELRAEMRVALMSIENKLTAGTQELKDNIQQRHGELEAKMEAIKAELEAKMEGTKADLQARMEGIKADLQARMDGIKADLQVKMEGIKAELQVKMEGIKAELVRWVFLTMLGSMALSAGAVALTEAVKHLL